MFARRTLTKCPALWIQTRHSNQHVHRQVSQPPTNVKKAVEAAAAGFGRVAVRMAKGTSPETAPKLSAVLIAHSAKGGRSKQQKLPGREGELSVKRKGRKKERRKAGRHTDRGTWHHIMGRRAPRAPHQKVRYPRRAGAVFSLRGLGRRGALGPAGR